MRVLSLSKPSKDLFDQWAAIYPDSNNKSSDILYRFWESTLSIVSEPDTITRVNKVITLMYSLISKDMKERFQLSYHFQMMREGYYKRNKMIQIMSETTEAEKLEKSWLYNKRWQEFVAELQLFLLPACDFRLKFADK